ncbi:MAG: MaoC/PaaZ C-terminal domain-containing protein [bacterium]
MAEFVDVTGDDPRRWVEAAPPGWAATALFAVAPLLLNDEVVASSSIIHGEQRFAWVRPIAAESDLEVIGVVSRVRERGGVWFLGFDLTVTDSEGDLITGSSSFIASGASAPGAAKAEVSELEPSEAEDGEFVASRADLIRYAAATRDWNPIHWDHRSAVAAGLPGIVVHGLMQSAWVLRSVVGDTEGPAPVANARFRYRAPLLAGRAASLVREREGNEIKADLRSHGQEVLSANIVSAT